MVGDLAFFDWQVNNDADHVGIITDLTTDENGRVLSFTTVEGNSGMAVTYGDVYSTSDPRVVGYGRVNLAYDRKIERQHRELTAEGTDFTVTASFDPDAKIPARAVLDVREAEWGTGEFDGLADDAEAWVNAGTGASLNFARFFELSFIDVEGDAVEPQGPVSYTIAFNDRISVSGGLTPVVAAIDDKGDFAPIEEASLENARVNGRKGSECHFTLVPPLEDEPDTAYVGAIVTCEPDYRAGTLSAKIPDHAAAIDYEAEAKVPDGAGAVVEWIEPGSLAYGRSISAVRGEIELQPGKLPMLCDVDIELNGIRIDPAQPVTVTLTVKAAGEGVRVIRVSDGREMDAELTRKGSRAVVKFDTDSFSAFCLCFED